jgi:hypothetical protein
MSDALGPNERKCMRCGNAFTRTPREGTDRFALRQYCCQACHYKARRARPHDMFNRPRGAAQLEKSPANSGLNEE